MINYDLAFMALEGLSRTPLTVSMRKNEVAVEGSRAAFKELARLCLLLGGEESEAGDAFELKAGDTIEAGGPLVKLSLIDL